jgi:hypothetical protein
MRFTLGRLLLLTLMGAVIQIPCLAAGSHHTAITRAGITVVQGGSKTQKVIVKIYTTLFRSNCPCPCPAALALKETGLNAISIIKNLEISVDGRAITVPTSVYDRLFEPHWASLHVENGNFVLRIEGMDAADSYFVRIYFDRESVSRVVDYWALVPDKPTSETRYFNVEFTGK